MAGCIGWPVDVSDRRVCNAMFVKETNAESSIEDDAAGVLSIVTLLDFIEGFCFSFLT